ncbi:hypothetical protein M514_02278 [Trichuris suis]|uniref:Ribosome production factor 2 homolog n=1 Tax=Trichuris suis TaxID=68888 RepID=A0A085NKX4_9BILA|nr:hypothetical protein M514_02278 [Trichuris suis]
MEAHGGWYRSWYSLGLNEQKQGKPQKPEIKIEVPEKPDMDFLCEECSFHWNRRCTKESYAHFKGIPIGEQGELATATRQRRLQFINQVLQEMLNKPYELSVNLAVGQPAARRQHGINTSLYVPHQLGTREFLRVVLMDEVELQKLKISKSVDSGSLIRKPKTQAGKRHLQKRLPKLVENDKSTIFIRGSKTSRSLEQCFDNLVLCNLLTVFGRMFNFNVLDMFEFGVENFASIYDFKKCRVPIGVKPCLLFMGDEFQSDPVFVRMKSLLIDFFRGPVITKLRLQGIEYALMFTAADGKVLVRAYSMTLIRIHLKKSNTAVPHVQLEAAGPSMDLIVRRNKIASDSLYKTACRVPSAVKPKKVKNTEQDVFGTTHGRIHVKQQSLDALSLSSPFPTWVLPVVRLRNPSSFPASMRPSCCALT